MLVWSSIAIIDISFTYGRLKSSVFKLSVFLRKSTAFAKEVSDPVRSRGLDEVELVPELGSVSAGQQARATDEKLDPAVQ